MKKNRLITIGLSFVFVLVAFTSVDVSVAQEAELCDYRGYFRDNGDFSCASGSLACKAPCAKKKKEVGIQ